MDTVLLTRISGQDTAWQEVMSRKEMLNAAVMELLGNFHEAVPVRLLMGVFSWEISDCDANLVQFRGPAAEIAQLRHVAEQLHHTVVK